MKNGGIALVMASVLFAFEAPAYADIIYSNLGPGSTYSTTSGAYLVDSQTAAVAMPFFVQAGSGFTLSQIDIAVFDPLPNPSTSDSITIALYSDTAGLPGTPLAGWLIEPPEPLASATGTIGAAQTISGISGATLSGGTQYWLVALGGAAAWADNSTGQSGLVATASSATGLFSSSNQTLGAFDVLGTPVSPSTTPEPSSLLLLGTGLVGLMGMGLYEKRLGRRELGPFSRVTSFGQHATEIHMSDGIVGLNLKSPLVKRFGFFPTLSV